VNLAFHNCVEVVEVVIMSSVLSCSSRSSVYSFRSLYLSELRRGLFCTSLYFLV